MQKMNKMEKSPSSGMLDSRASRFTLKLPDFQPAVDQLGPQVLPKSGSHYTRMDSLLGDEKANTEIEVPAFFAWFLLLFNVLTAAIVPCWLMGDVKSQSLTRNSWRYFMLSILLIPFVAYEQRNIRSPADKEKNKLTLTLIKSCFISSINYCLWVCISVYATKFTSLTHTFCLIRLRYFVVAIMKFRNKLPYHQVEIGGVILSIVGVGCMLWDSGMMPVVRDHQIENQRYLNREAYHRLLGDLLAFSGSIVSAYLDEIYQVPKVPRFTNQFLYNFFLAFNFVSFGYFFGGSQFSLDIHYGVFGLFTYTNFVNVFYVSIMLGLNLMISSIMIDQMFSQMIRNIAGNFQMLLTSLLYNSLNFQIPSQGGFTSIGFGFLIPGIILVITGQNILKNREFKVDYILYKPSERNSYNSRKSKEIEPIRQSAEEFSRKQDEPVKYPLTQANRKRIEARRVNIQHLTGTLSEDQFFK